MRAYKITHEDKEVGYVSSRDIAVESLLISWSRFNPKAVCGVGFVTIVREGFPDLCYTLEPIDVWTEPTHL